MDKYTSIQEAIYSILSSQEFKDEGIKTYPQNFQGKIDSKEYIKIFILIGKTLPTYSNVYTGAGQIIIDIFTPAGEGPTRAFQIADLLDGYFAGKSFGSTNGIQTGPSTLVQLGVYEENPSLYKCSYTINFSYFGGT